MAIVSSLKDGKLETITIPGIGQNEYVIFNGGTLVVNGSVIFYGEPNTILTLVSHIRVKSQILEYLFLSEKHGTISVHVPLPPSAQDVIHEHEVSGCVKEN